MKIKDATAPYPRMARATVLFFTNFFVFISYSPLKIDFGGAIFSSIINRPWLWLYTMELRFENANIDFKFDVEKDHWYNIIIEQNSFSGKVMRCL